MDTNTVKTSFTILLLNDLLKTGCIDTGIYTQAVQKVKDIAHASTESSVSSTITTPA